LYYQQTAPLWVGGLLARVRNTVIFATEPGRTRLALVIFFYEVLYGPYSNSRTSKPKRRFVQAQPTKRTTSFAAWDKREPMFSAEAWASYRGESRYSGVVVAALERPAECVRRPALATRFGYPSVSIGTTRMRLSIPSSVCSPPSRVAMKHASTHRPGKGVQHLLLLVQGSVTPWTSVLVAVSELGVSPVLMVSLGSNNNKVVSTSEQGWCATPRGTT